MNRALLVVAMSLLGVFALGQFAPGRANAQAVEEGENDDEAARRHFRLGQAYYENGQFAQAADEFQAAYDLSGRSVLLYNVYLSHRDALHTRQSYEALRRYLDEVPNPPDEDRLRARLRHLENALANSPEEDPEVEPEDEPDVAPDTSTEMGEPQTTTTETTGQTMTSRPQTQTESESMSPVPFIAMGAGGGLLVGGVVAALISRGARSDLDSLCNVGGTSGACPEDSNWESLRDKGQRSARTADVMIPLGGAAAIAGVVLYFVMQPSDDGATADADGRSESARLNGGVACDGTGCMATLGGSF